jgi:uncharacterized protein YecE (DUF72 family)
VTVDDRVDVLPASSGPVVYVGCPMWAHPPWVGRFLSPGARGRELEEYARWCNAVEGNTTFYAVPAPSTVARWDRQAPAGFRFAFKAPRQVTHELRLRGDARRALASFLSAIEPLADRLGPVQLQLPASFGPSDLPALRSFVETLPASHRWVIELRHRSFFGGEARRAVDDLLAERGIGRVVLDTRPLYAHPPVSEASVEERRTKPKLPVLVDVMGDAPVVRVIGSDDTEGTLAGLRAWIPRVVDWLAEGRTPYLFVHQPDNRESPALARAIHAEIAALRPDLAPLPTPLPVAPASEIIGQDSLF